MSVSGITIMLSPSLLQIISGDDAIRAEKYERLELGSAKIHLWDFQRNFQDISMVMMVNDVHPPCCHLYLPYYILLEV